VCRPTPCRSRPRWTACSRPAWWCTCPHAETIARGEAAARGWATRLEVSSIADPACALIGTGFPFRETDRLDQYLEQFRRVATRTSGIRRPGSAALDLADVAAGRVEAFWEQRLSA
jgi:myo-inositol-1(or 4)-monophosphatase